MPAAAMARGAHACPRALGERVAGRRPPIVAGIVATIVVVVAWVVVAGLVQLGPGIGTRRGGGQPPAASDRADAGADARARRLRPASVDRQRAQDPPARRDPGPRPGAGRARPGGDDGAPVADRAGQEPRRVRRAQRHRLRPSIPACRASAPTCSATATPVRRVPRHSVPHPVARAVGLPKGVLDSASSARGWWW